MPSLWGVAHRGSDRCLAHRQLKDVARRRALVMSKENNEPTFEGYEPSMLFREFAAECAELAQGTPSPEKRTLYLKMASVWHQMALRWEKKG